jgi:hypothetical protein
MNKEKYNNLLQYDLDQYLIDACIDSDFELVKYLLTSNELSIHADINTLCHGENGQPLRTAFCYKNFELANYLLTSPELKEHADIHVASDDIFRSAFYRKQIDVLTCLIFDYDIKRTKNIDFILSPSNNHNHIEMKKLVEKMFTTRSLNKELNKELNNELDKKMTISENKHKERKI